MIRFLVRFQRRELVRIYSYIIPVNVELGVGVFALGDTPTHVLLDDLLDQWVFSP